ncbi:gfo/Idh/MocA family oxidoreductase [Legionella sp. MW5194]|uniref:Gfo/Idh/MocA family protein n=1 Tax=Legionella sp. MW5194 TaxID=2662448 RepID=UPI00193D31ED|nr:Gfo/Idh/MocA family oxidoreductase [Legionella sp. MW5194]QRN04747.1 gfo/Idh/MocA family oxidoreductase [Legionella sp. MW5194]
MVVRRLNWGILGTSFISEVIAAAIVASDTGELKAVASRNEERARSFASTFAIHRYYANYEQLLFDPTIDVVYIGLPNHLHFEWILKAAAAGKHILCEKPLVLTAQEVQQVIVAIKKANVLCMEALMYRHHPFIQELQRVIEAGALGVIRQINAFYCANIARLANPVAGGCIRNLGCYPLSLTRFLLKSEPIHMVALGRVDEQGHDRQASMILQFPRGALANIATSDELEMSWYYELIGDEGCMQLKSNPWLPPQTENCAIIKDKNGSDVLHISIDAVKPLYSYQIDTLGNAILGVPHSGSDVISLEDSLGNIQILEKWLKQIRELKTEPLSLN